jgi:hypothetical protein
LRLIDQTKEKRNKNKKMVHHSCCNKQKVKRGLWSPEEDEKLIKYIKTYGHGCWSSVPKLAGTKTNFIYIQFTISLNTFYFFLII